MITKQTAWEQRRNIAKHKAIVLADIGMQNQNLPTYSELVAALKATANFANLGAHERAGAMNAARALLARIPA